MKKINKMQQKYNKQFIMGDAKEAITDIIEIIDKMQIDIDKLKEVKQ